MDFAPTEQPEGLPDGRPAEQSESRPQYVAPIQPVAPSSRRSLPLIAGAILAGAIGLTAVAVGLSSAGTPATAAPAPANARGVLLGADTGTWTAPNGGTATAPNAPGVNGPGMMGDDNAGGFGPGGFGPGGGMGRGGRMGGAGAFGSISITAIDGTKLGLTTSSGWTRTIDGAGATVSKGGQTVDISTLKVGDSIAFSQTRQADGTFKITAIQVVLPHVQGTVKTVSGTSVTITQRDGTDRTIVVTGSTTYTLAGAASTGAALTVGALVDAEGTTAADSTFTATLVNIQPAQAGGSVTAINTSTTPATIVVKTRAGASLTINVGSSTTYQVAGKTTASLSDIALGAIVMAEGTPNANGSFTATVVRAFPAGTGFGPGMRGGHGMPWAPGTPGTPVNPAPTGTTN
jgi:Domain of unknown function (DUF5666)